MRVEEPVQNEPDLERKNMRQESLEIRMRLLGQMLTEKPSFPLPLVDGTHLLRLRLEESGAVHDRLHGVLLPRQPLH